ncbi:MAG: 1-acyl-sn-glycerol-3-phosphate acyltransferase [Paludibacteraceae bacterium]|nr:1-acyl-sn-glycerol-3-phosphate acyltransferase [Paludibacteraceae bacterium]
MFLYKVLCWLVYLLFRPQLKEVKGLGNLPDDRGFLVVANHQNNYDPLIIAAAMHSFFQQHLNRKIYFIGSPRLKNEFFRHPFISALLTVGMDSIGYLPAHRDSLRRSTEFIADGNVVVIFPEGGRNPNKTLKRGRRGAAVIALLSGCPVVPIGSFGPKTYGLKEGILGFFASKKLVIGKPFCFEPKSQQEINANPRILVETTNEIMQKIAEVAQKQCQQAPT